MRPRGSVGTCVCADELMSHPAIRLPEEWTLAGAQPYFARYRYTAFPVVDRSGRALGMLSINHLEQTPPARWPNTHVGERADRDPGLLIARREDVAHRLQQPTFARLGRAAVIDEERRPVGVVSLTDLERTLRAARLSGTPPAAPIWRP